LGTPWRAKLCFAAVSATGRAARVSPFNHGAPVCGLKTLSREVSVFNNIAT